MSPVKNPINEFIKRQSFYCELYFETLLIADQKRRQTARRDIKMKQQRLRHVFKACTIFVRKTLAKKARIKFAWQLFNVCSGAQTGIYCWYKLNKTNNNNEQKRRKWAGVGERRGSWLFVYADAEGINMAAREGSEKKRVQMMGLRLIMQSHTCKLLQYNKLRLHFHTQENQHGS